MALNHSVILYAGNKTIPATVHVVQGDTGRVLICEIADYTIPSGAAAKLWCRRPGGTYYEYTGTVSTTNNTATFELDAEDGALTNAGLVECQVKLTVSGEIISTFDLHIVVHPSKDGVPQPGEIPTWEQLREDIDKIKTAVLYTPQILTPEQKRQAKENIGVSEILPTDLFDGTKATYDKVMREWFQKRGAALITPAELTNLCAEWYTITRTGWNGKTTFAQPDLSTSSSGTKGGDNAGMVCTPSTDTAANRDDYAGVPLFAIRNVNWILDSETGDIIITQIEGITAGFAKNDPGVYVGVMQMTGYTYQEERTTEYVIGYTDNVAAPIRGLRPLPEAIRTDNTVRPFVVHGKYMSKTVNGKMTCCSGQIPTAWISHNSLITLSAQNGAQYSGGTAIDWSFLVLMTMIKYGSMTQDGVNQGCVNNNYQYYAAVSELDTNRVILQKSQAANLVVGGSVLVGTYMTTADRGNANVYGISTNDGATITAIEDIVIEGTTYSAVYVDCGTFDSVANGSAVEGSTIISTWHWKSGTCDTVLGNDGSPVPASNGKYLAMIQGIECSVGGYEVFADVILNIADGAYTPYLARRRSKQATSVTADMVASELTSEQPASDSWNYIRRLKYDGEIFFGTDTVGGSSSTYTKDAFYKNGVGTATGTREWLAFGNLGSGTGYGGLSCLGGVSALSYGLWGYLARLSPNGNRGESAA